MGHWEKEKGKSEEGCETAGPMSLIRVKTDLFLSHLVKSKVQINPWVQSQKRLLRLIAAQSRCERGTCVSDANTFSAFSARWYFQHDVHQKGSKFLPYGSFVWHRGDGERGEGCFRRMALWQSFTWWEEGIKASEKWAHFKCGSCYESFVRTLLSQRSWNGMLTSLFCLWPSDLCSRERESDAGRSPSASCVVNPLLRHPRLLPAVKIQRSEDDTHTHTHSHALHFQHSQVGKQM